MAQVTQLTVLGIPGAVRTFIAKTPAVGVLSGEVIAFYLHIELMTRFYLHIEQSHAYKSHIEQERKFYLER